MATRIRFKRGETDIVKSYLDAYVGEPLYDLQKGTLYITKEDGELFPVSGIANIVDTLPTFNSSDHTGRMVYDSSTNMFYFGSNTKWQHTSPEFCNEHQDVDLTGQTTVDLDFHDDLAIATVNLTGTLSEDVIVTFPQKNQVYTITNDTSGDFTVKLKVISKTVETNISQNTTILVLNNTNQIINISENYFDSKTNEYSRELLTKETSSELRSYLELGNASHLNWGTEIGNLVRLVDDGSGNPTISPDIINLIHELIITPEITAPLDGAGAEDPASTTIEGSGYVSIYSAYTRDYRIFQIKEEGEEWDTSVIEFTGDVDDKEFTTLTPDTIYVARIKDVDILGNESNWSDEVTFNTSSVYVETPDLTVETSVDGNAVLSPLLTGSAFNVIGTSTSHDYTDWEIIRVDTGSTVWSSLADSTNKESITVDIQLDTNTNYEFRVRYIDDAVTPNVSAWKSVTLFTINIMINTPVLDVEVDGESGKIFRSDPLLETNAFSVFPTSALDIHLNTDWRVIKNSDSSTVWSSLTDTENKTSIRMDYGILEVDETYTFEVRHRGELYGVSNWDSEVLTTEDNFDHVIAPESTDDTFPQDPTLESYGGSGWTDSVEDGYYNASLTEEPLNMFHNGSELTKNSDVSSLAEGEWGFGNVDGLSENVVYIRLVGDTNPNSEDLEDVQLEPKYAIEKIDIGGLSYINSTAPGYYLNSSTTEPVNLYYNGTQLVRGATLSNLNQDEWGYGDLDTIGDDRIYVRLFGDINPSTLDSDALQYSIKQYWEILYYIGPQFAFLGYTYNHYGTKLEIYDLDGIKIYEREQFNEFDPSVYSFIDQISAQSSGSTLVTASDSESTAFRLFDKNDVQYWQISGNSGWVQYEFDTERRPYLGSYSLTIRDTTSAPSQAPKDFTLQGSVAGTDWMVLDTQTDVDTWTAGQTKTFTIDPISGTGYRYYKLVITDNNGHTTTELSQIKLYTHTEENVNEIIGVDDFSNIDPNTTYNIRIGYNTNIEGFTAFSFGSFIKVTTGDTIDSLVSQPSNIVPEDNETEVDLSPELESSVFSSGLTDSLEQLHYEVIKVSGDTVAYEFITTGIVNQPTNISPSDGAIDTDLSPELESSNFSFTGSSDTLVEREYIVRKNSDRTIVYSTTI